MWTSAAAAYVLGPPILPVFWLAAPLGFALIVLLDTAGLVPAVGLAAESARRWRGEPFAIDCVADGDIRHSLALSEHAVRVAAIARLPGRGAGAARDHPDRRDRDRGAGGTWPRSRVAWRRRARGRASRRRSDPTCRSSPSCSTG